MNPYTIFGAGFLSGAILVSGGFLISTKGGAVVYTSSDANTASVLIVGGDTEISDSSIDEILEDNTEEAPAGSQEVQSTETAQVKEVEESSVQSAPSSDYVTELQEQVEALVEQVNAQTVEPVEAEDDGGTYFITPTGVKVKIDEDGNVINEDGSTVQSVQTQPTEPGVFITPGGVKIDAEGNIIE